MRERQKAERRLRLLEAAAAHFSEVGYEAARVEAIAEAAELSTGTLYNYYSQKSELLLAAASLQLESVLAQAEPLVGRPPLPAESAINALIETYLDHALACLSRDNWRHALALALTQAGSPMGRHYVELEARRADQLRRLLDTLQQSGALAAGVDTIALGRMVFHNMAQLFAEHVRGDGESLAALKAGLRAQHAALCRLTG